MDKYESLYFNSPEPEAEVIYTSPDGNSGVKASNGALCLYDKIGAVYLKDAPQNRVMTLTAIYQVDCIEMEQKGEKLC